MNTKPNPNYAEFTAWLTTVQPTLIVIKGDYFRVAGPRHTTALEIVSGVGALKGCGRWNPEGHMAVVYMSESPSTAMEEAVQREKYFGLPMTNSFPKVTVTIRVEATNVLDLTDPSISSSLPVSLPQLMDEDWRKLNNQNRESDGQALSRAAFDAGIKGILAYSNPVPKQKNLLVYPHNLTNADVLIVQNPERLDSLGKVS